MSYEGIKEQFKEVIRYSQGIPEPQVDSLFRRWEKAKQKFIQRFEGLIYEWPEPVEFHLDPREQQSRAMEFANCVHDTYNNPVLAEFIDDNLETFFENKVSNSKGPTVPNGMKLIKAFKFFEHNKTTLREIQDAASQLIQENKIKGTLCFSVHPLDFLSSSENTYNWRSCHALDGEFRAGNLSYMVDNTTFMVYLKGADGQTLHSFGSVKWNSKKWRMLVHASEDDDIIFAGRQYPFNSKAGIDIVLNLYNNIIVEEGHRDIPYVIYLNKYNRWSDTYIDSYVENDVQKALDTRYLIFNGALLSIDSALVEGMNALNYNDILRSSCYNYPYYAIRFPYTSHSLQYHLEHPIIVGEEVSCLHCGDDCISNSGTMRCDDCEMKYGFEENEVYGCCSCCGARLYIDDAYFCEDELICDSCYNNETFTCEMCDEVFYNRHAVYLPGEDGEDGLYVCTDCAHNHNDKEN